MFLIFFCLILIIICLAFYGLYIIIEMIDNIDWSDYEIVDFFEEEKP